MFSYKERMMVVELYMQRGCNVGAVLRELGYPSPGALRQWHKEFMKTGDLKKTSSPKPRFTQEQINVAVDHYFTHGNSYTRTSQSLGYPCRTLLAKWVANSGKLVPKPCKSPRTVVKYTIKEKQEAVLLCVSGLPDYKVAAQYGVCAATIYGWRKRFLGEEASMKRKHTSKTSFSSTSTQPIKPIDTVVSNITLAEFKSLELSVSQLQEEKAQLLQELEQLRFEQDVIETTVHVLKKQRASI